MNFYYRTNETSDNRPYTFSNLMSATSFDNDNLETIQTHLNDTDEDPFQDQQGISQEDQYEDAPQEQPLAQHNTITPQQENTLTIQNFSDQSDVITNNQPSLTVTTDSNLLDIPVR